ncbi:hypothetical protein GLE_3859 [Lysobacter enzymogenes]|uniref:Uncharacterized protein n=1 Tax=Lysobacter enzymogenes TaxID=69 RepID=A0A0S2DL10_LYSEN|nr:hypothetical protein GLE_3859 [Lysobacter enzymogenes]
MAVQRAAAIQRQVHPRTPDWPPRAALAASVPSPPPAGEPSARPAGRGTSSPRWPRNRGRPRPRIRCRARRRRHRSRRIGSFVALEIGPPDGRPRWLA